MKKFLALVSAFTAVQISAQVTLTQTEFPQAGDVYTMNMADTAGVLAGNGGTGVTWNFSTLNTAQGTMIDSFLAVNATPYGATYPQSNLAKHETGPSIDYFVYYDVAAPGASRVGNADTVNVITYSDPAGEFTFPLTYGTTGNDTYYAMYTDQSSTSIVHVHGVITSNADGTGTLQLPSATYGNVLRAHYTRDEHDTVFTSSGNYADHIVVNYWLWYIPGRYYPVLSIQTTFIDLGFTQQYRKYVGWRTPPLGISSPIAQHDFRVYPNPATDMLTISCPANGKVRIYSVDGKLLSEQEVKNAAGMAFDASAFEPGVLLVVFTNEKMVLRKEIVIAR